jgi:hypothetical protein
VKININIDRLVFDGVKLAAHERPLFQAAFENEMTRLIARDGLHQELRAGGAFQSVGTPAVQLSEGNNPHQIGRQLAHAVYRGIGQ